MELTVDTSVVLAVILNEASKVQMLEVTHRAELVAAPTLHWEVGHALTALFRRRRLDFDAAGAALESYGRIPIRLVDVDVGASVKMASEHGIYAYDAYVIECARRCRTPLLSLDRVQCQVGRALGIAIVEVSA